MPIVEYLHLSQLFELADHFYELFECRSAEDFRERYRPVNDLRNEVMHSRSLITAPNSCERLWTIVDLIEEAIFILRHFW